MLDIKNPHTRKRLSIKEKFDIKFTNFILPYIEKIEIDENGNTKSKYIPKALGWARSIVDGWGTRKWASTNPIGVELDLLSLYVAEYIPIENVDELNKGLKKLMKKYPMSHQYGQVGRLNEFCNAVKQSIHGGRWSDFGYIEFGEEDTLSDFVKSVHIHGTHLSSSSIILQFVISPSDKFLHEHKTLIERDIDDRRTFNSFLKKPFKFWGGQEIPSEIVKNQMLEDQMLELKWRTMNKISKYFDLYFTKNNLIPPGIEVYKLDQPSCIYKPTEEEKMSRFWHSVGLDDFLYDISKDGCWNLFSGNRVDRSIDSTLKVTCNSFISRMHMYYSLDFQIVHMLEEFTKKMLPIMVMREYALETGKKVSIQQSNTFSSIKKENPKYKKLIKIRLDLERDIQLLKRFKNEIGENYFERVKERLLEMTEFEPSRPRISNGETETELIVDNTSELVDKTYDHSLNFAKIIDDTSKLLEIKTNNSLRKISISLTVTTVVISIFATVIAGVSFYLQLDSEKQDKINDFFSPLINLVTYFF
ncbi:hypothetical protein [Thalassobacillus sp. CUG 92003]|uniref:hypothetical protein n=1 Tax=Thalassobacillus sp. CUG 92003 TaxID=2736641 RepID=UPI0015E6AAA6|nr:hypothetical protein [Thalassobacillus sp. CUG 92003]